MHTRRITGDLYAMMAVIASGDVVPFAEFEIYKMRMSRRVMQPPAAARLFRVFKATSSVPAARNVTPCSIKCYLFNQPGN